MTVVVVGLPAAYGVKLGWTGFVAESPARLHASQIAAGFGNLGWVGHPELGWSSASMSMVFAARRSPVACHGQLAGVLVQG